MSCDCRSGVQVTAEDGYCLGLLCDCVSHDSTCGGMGDIEVTLERHGYPYTALAPCPVCGKARKIARAITQAKVPGRALHVVRGQISPTAEQIAAWKAVDGWMQRREEGSSRGVMLQGPKGCGKTFTAASILARCVWDSPGKRARWVNVSTLADALHALIDSGRSCGEDHVSAYLDSIRTADLVVLDELGMGIRTDWDREVCARLIQHRYDHDRTTIFTTMLDLGKIEAALGDYGSMVVSRLREMTELVRMCGPDLRGARLSGPDQRRTK